MLGKKKPEPVIKTGPDLEWCKDASGRILDILYERDDISLLEWRIVFGRIQQEVMTAEATLAVKTAIAKIQFLPVPVPIPMGGEPHKEHEILKDDSKNPLSN